MGFASFFRPGTLMQLIAVVLFTFFYTMVLLVCCRPYEDPVDDMLAMTNQAMLFVMLLSALMLKVKQCFSATAIYAYEEGYDATLVETLLVGSAVVVAISAITTVGFRTVLVLKSRRERAEAEQIKEEDGEQEGQQEEQQEEQQAEQQEEQQGLPPEGAPLVNGAHVGHASNSEQPTESTDMDITMGRKIVV
jgi:hypothetical protein